MANQEQPRGRRQRRSRRRQQREQEEARRRKRYMIGGGVIGAVLLLVIGLTVVDLVSGGDEAEEDPFPSVQAAGADYADIQSEPYFLGDPDAPVHLVEYGDYQ